MYSVKCDGCKHEAEVQPTQGNSCGLGCEVYSNPRAMWRRGNCPMATHVAKTVHEDKKVNPLKASKRAKKGKGK